MKNWEEDDYYDSDEDSFFDRTGDLEAKRKQRMNQVKKDQPETDTYETLVCNQFYNLIRVVAYAILDPLPFFLDKILSH